MTAQILHGNNLDILPTLADCSVDAIVTDPPYELGFMGKQWDASGIAYNVTLWAECLRVLKPGGHLLAFGGTRTYHRMAVAIEDAGFEIRDSIHWVYGSGFPKSLDVSKAIDKRGGATAGFEEFRDAVRDAMKRNSVSRANLAKALGNHMLSHYLTAGSQPAVPNARDYRIIRDAVGLGSAWDHLFIDEAQREVIGKSDSTLLAVAPGEGRDRPQITLDITAPATDAARQWKGWGTALKPAHEPIVLARKPLVGTVANNALTHGTGALNIDACRIQREPGDTSHAGHRTATFGTQNTTSGGDGSGNWEQNNLGRWPANIILDPEAAEELGPEARYFYCAKPSKAERNAGLDGLDERQTTGGGGLTATVREDGSYETASVAGKYESVKAKQQNHHPTVKPIALMRYLIRLVTPPDGTVLDPFAGSGTTLTAATLENFNSVGIELTADYLPIIQARITWAEQQTENQAPQLFST